MKNNVVYTVNNNKKDRLYVGRTNDFKKRMVKHRRYPPIKMEQDMLDYGWLTDFDKKVVFEGTKEECIQKEIELIKELSPYYNTSSGTGNGLLGETAPNSKLTNIEAMEIRYLYVYADGYNQTVLAKLYNISSQNLSQLVLGISYKDAGGPISKPNQHPTGTDSTSSKFSKSEVLEIRALGYTTKITYVAISKQYGGCGETISNMIRGITYKSEGGLILGKDYQKRGEGNGDK